MKAATDWLKAGATPPAANANDQYVMGSVGIGTTNPDASTALDVTAANKGFLAPRVPLNSNTDVTTIPNPATGLLVYNTGAGLLKAPGYMYWSGTEWRSVNNSSAINPAISALNCAAATIFPLGFTAGTAYSGTLTVPYTGGNGGNYPSGTAFTQHGLTFTQQAGTLNYGSGSITYSVTGTPDFTSPNVVSIDQFPAFLGIGGCAVSIGNNITIKTLQFAKSTTLIDANVQTNSVTTIRNISIRANQSATNLTATSNSLLDFRINNGDNQYVTTKIFWLGGTAVNGNYYFWFWPPRAVAVGSWYPIISPGQGVTVNNSDALETVISLINTGEIYRVNVVMNGNLAAKTTAPTVVAAAASITIFVEQLQ